MNLGVLYDILSGCPKEVLVRLAEENRLEAGGTRHDVTARLMEECEAVPAARQDVRDSLYVITSQHGMHKVLKRHKGGGAQKSLLAAFDAVADVKPPTTASPQAAAKSKKRRTGPDS